jgi:hypothetical protein
MPEKSLLEKLQIKKGRSVLFLNPPPDYSFALGEVSTNIKFLQAKRGGLANVIQLFVKTSKELENTLPGLQEKLAPGGILWVTYHKGTCDIQTDLNRDRIREYAGQLGWKAVAIISVDQDWSALRLKWLGND